MLDDFVHPAVTEHLQLRAGPLGAGNRAVGKRGIAQSLNAGIVEAERRLHVALAHEAGAGDREGEGARAGAEIRPRASG